VDTLLKHGLVRIAGRKKSVGSPLLFRTTERFLEIFGLAGISSLPSLDELKEYRSDDGVFDSLEGPDKVSEEDDSDEWIRQ
jgi:segregation and condensation protein B